MIIYRYLFLIVYYVHKSSSHCTWKNSINFWFEWIFKSIKDILIETCKNYLFVYCTAACSCKQVMKIIHDSNFLKLLLEMGWYYNQIHIWQSWWLSGWLMLSDYLLEALSVKFEFFIDIRVMVFGREKFLKEFYEFILRI